MKKIFYGLLIVVAILLATFFYFKKKGITLPLDPSTFPYLTTENLITEFFPDTKLSNAGYEELDAALRLNFYQGSKRIRQWQIN